MNSATLTERKFFGLVELDAHGTVLYSRNERNGASGSDATILTGANFLTEVAPFGDVVEFRQRLEEFMKSQSVAESFTFTCGSGKGPEQIKVLLARIRERTNNEHTKSILVHIRAA